MNALHNLTLMKNNEFNSSRKELLDKAIDYISTKYNVSKRNLYIAGGCTLDLAYDLDFYDIDMYVYVEDIDVSNIERNASADMYAVLPHKIDGVDVDLIITTCNTVEKLRLFDIDIKTIVYNNKTFHVNDKVLEKLQKNTFGIFPNVDWSIFRYMKTAKKYSLETDSRIIYLLNNHLLYKINENKTVYMSEKYKSMWGEYLKYLNDIKQSFLYNKRLAMKTAKIIKHNKYCPKHRISLDKLYKYI